MAKGEFALVSQNMQVARPKAGQPVKRGTMAHEHNLYMLLAEAATQQRDLSALQQYAPLLEELAQRDGHKLYQGIAHRAWGVAHRLAGDTVEAGVRLNQALELFSEYGARWQLGRTFLEMGELGLAQADEEMAHQNFARALQEFEAMGAVPDVERVRLALAELA